VDKRGDTLYTDRRMMLLLMDKIVEFERTDKSGRNPTIAEATLAEDDGATVEAVKANKKKGKGKGQGQREGQRCRHECCCHLCRRHPEDVVEAMQILQQGRTRGVGVLHEAEPGKIQTQDGQRGHRWEGANGLGKRALVMGDVPVAKKMAVKASVLPLCQENKYTICAAQDDDASPSRRPFIKFHLRKNVTSQTPTITALYDTGAAVSLITPSNFEAIKRSGVVIGEIPGMTCWVQNASQQPMQTEGAWRVRLYLKGRSLSAAMIVTNDVAQSIIGMNNIEPRRLVMDPISCTVDFRDEGAAAALGVLRQREDGTIADVRMLRATTIPDVMGNFLS
jgi:hypothetical protein